MKKISLILFILCGVMVLNTSKALAVPFNWYFGSNPTLDYKKYIAGPVSLVLVSATFHASNDLRIGFLKSSDTFATLNNVLNNSNDGWAIGLYQRWPGDGISNWAFDDAYYSFNPYSLSADDSLTNLPNGVYKNSGSKIGYQDDSGVFIEVPPDNDFIIEIGDGDDNDPGANPTATPEPASMLLLGMGSLAMAILKRKKKLI